MPNLARDVVGEEFGYLTAVRPTEERTRYGVIWLVKCRCGNEKKMALSDLVKKPRREGQMPRSCGCYRKRNRSPKYKGVGDLSSTKFRGIMAKAKRRGLPFAITIEYAWELFLKQNKRCALTGMPLSLSPSSMEIGASTASLDRIDSAKGYEIGNVQWVHVTLNFMKTSLSQSAFIEWCGRVSDYARGKISS